ncbi:Hypothetical_protein [Hexamita inflata]|uniref:Hypothetical_protein n=1 Tax=Hexamita inflata TaxID=28002 RepID=A0AA86UYS6_9EUKA|nr:Hypothetical protein HINF_LOCUS65055 [Hexamita inflata]
MSKKNPYCCVLTWFCLLFLSLLVAGITLACIPTEYSYPIYNEYNNNLSYYWSYNYAYQNVGLGVTLSIVGLFGFFITISFSCILKKKSVSSEIEPFVPKQAVNPPQMNYQQVQYSQPVQYQQQVQPMQQQIPQYQAQQFQMAQPVQFVKPNMM